MNLNQLRQRWLQAARVYYLAPGDDTGMSDHQWDAIGQHLVANKAAFPECPILNSEGYEGGSLFWVRRGEYETALGLYRE